MEEEERKKEMKQREAEKRAKLCEELRAKRVQQKQAKGLCTALYKSGPKKGLQCTTLCLPDANGAFLCGRHQHKENALLNLVPLEVEAPTSSRFQQASSVALELERQEEEELERQEEEELERQEEELERQEELERLEFEESLSGCYTVHIIDLFYL